MANKPFEVQNGIKLGAGETIVDSQGNELLNQSAIARSIVFPTGEEGDTQGTIALTETGDTFICTADWEQATGSVGMVAITTTEEYLIGQSGGTLLAWVTSLGDYPDIQALFEAVGYTSGSNFPYPNPEYFSVASPDTVEPGAPRVCTDVGINSSGNLYFYIAYTSGDATGLPVGSSADIAWEVPAVQPAIWNQINFNSGSLSNYRYTDQESGYESSLQFAYDFNVDVENAHLTVNGSGGWEIGSNALNTTVFNSDTTDQGTDPLDIVIRANDNDWVFTRDSELKFPDGSIQTTAYTGFSEGSPLFVVVNSDGNNAWSNDGTTWTEGTQLPTDGFQYERVSVANSYIVYIQGFEGPGELAFATTYGSIPALVTFNTTGTEYYAWNDIQSHENYTVAVGAFYGDDGSGGNTASIPVWAYTTNGTNWTIGATDPGFQSFNEGGGFRSVDYGNNGWFFVAQSGGPSGAGGFFTSSLTVQLTMTNYVPFGESLPEGYYPNISSVVWDGLRWWVRDDNAPTYYVSSGANPLTSTWTDVSLDIQAIDQAFGETGNSFYEDAGGLINGVGWFAVASSDGQILASNNGGNTWYGSVPLPYTSTLALATIASTCVVTFNGNTPNANGELIIISNANPSNYNGTYFSKNVEGTFELYTDVALTIPLDSSGFGTFVSADVTLNRGQYIDSLGFGLEKFIVGNDDDQLFTSTDLNTWTLVNDQSEQGFAYWNDISFNATWGATGGIDTGNITFSGNQIRGTQTNDYFGLIELVPSTTAEGAGIIDFLDNGQYIRIYPTNEFDSPHIHIAAGTGGTQNGDLFIGDDNKYLQVNDQGWVSVGTYNYDTTDGYIWEFGNDGRLYFPGSYTYTIGETDGGIELRSGDSIILTANTVNAGQEKFFAVESNGKVRLSGATYSQPATPAPGQFASVNDMLLSVTGIDGLGAVTEITVTNSPNVVWQAGTYPVYLTGDINYTIIIDGSGNATVSSITSGNGHSLSESWSINGTDFGAPGATTTALDLTKQTQVLTSTLTTGNYSLADGTEGQIMYFVPNSTIDGTVYITIDNARIYDGVSGYIDVQNYPWVPFGGETLAPTTIAMAIFADGAWCLRGGITD